MFHLVAREAECTPFDPAYDHSDNHIQIDHNVHDPFLCKSGVSSHQWTTVRGHIPLTRIES